MKRVGGLWEAVVSFENLHEAARRAALGKKKRHDVAGFLMRQEEELVLLQRALSSGEYAPGAYREFMVNDAKPRLISAAPFRDRVVHHALTQILEPLFEKRFSNDSFACRRGMGTHKALARAKHGVAGFAYVFKCDVKKYFASIDHQILKDLLARLVKCSRTLDLAGKIIDGSNAQEPVLDYYPGDTLFTPCERRRGIPLGNQTSQFFANVYLNPIDQLVNRDLRAACYVRYVDDLLLFSDSKDELLWWRQALEQSLAKLRIRIHESKSRIYNCRSDGATFLGFRLFPGRTRLARTNVTLAKRRLRTIAGGFHAGKFGWDEVRARMYSWIGHAAHADTWRLREWLFDGFAVFAHRGASTAAEPFDGGVQSATM